MPGSSRQANEPYNKRTRGDEIAVFDPKNLPVQHEGEHDEAFRLRSLRFWRKYPQEAPPWARQELMDIAEAVFDEFLLGTAAEEASSDFAELTRDSVQYAKELVKAVLEKREDPNPVFRTILKATLDHASKLTIERLKGRNTLRVEAQRHRDEITLLKQAQGNQTLAERIILDHVGINRGGPPPVTVETTATALDSVEEVPEGGSGG